MDVDEYPDKTSRGNLPCDVDLTPVSTELVLSNSIAILLLSSLIN